MSKTGRLYSMLEEIYQQSNNLTDFTTKVQETFAQLDNSVSKSTCEIFWAMMQTRDENGYHYF